jgi:anti-sigma factor RsiW
MVMKCEEIREVMPDLASGLMAMTPEIGGHLADCGACAGKMEEFRRTMALLDEWKAPEPSPYFDVRLQARLREEMAKSQAGWATWFRRPVLAAALTVLMGIGVGLFFTKGSGIYSPGNNVVADSQVQAEPGTAVSDLQALEKNHDLYSDFDLLDDLEVQRDVVANP